MKVPYFKAKDKDSDQWVEGFYVQFPMQHDVEDCPLVHAIMIPIPDENSLSPDEADKIPQELTEVVENFTVNGEDGYKLSQLNTLMYCTIDFSTLEKIKDIEVEPQNEEFIVLKPKGIFKCLAKMLRFFR